MHIAVVSTAASAARARLTVRHAAAVGVLGDVRLLDVDGSYVPVDGERVLRPSDIGVPRDELRQRATSSDLAGIARSLEPALARWLATSTPGLPDVLVLTPGVVLLTAPTSVAQALEQSPLVLVARSPRLPPPDDRHPDALDLALEGPYATAMVGVRADDDELLDLWQRSTLAPVQGRWAELAAAALPHVTLRDPASLLSAWSLAAGDVLSDSATGLLLDGRPVHAVDLTQVVPDAPWLLGPTVGDPRGRLSEHPALARFVRDSAARLSDAAVPLPEDGWDLQRTSLGLPVDATWRAAYAETGPGDPWVDPFDPAAADALVEWLTSPSDSGGPGRYLRAVRAARPDLVRSFPHVPGADDAAYLAWLGTHAVDEGYDRALVHGSLQRIPERPSTPGRRPPGVNVVGFLRGGLGIGESARLTAAALGSVGVPVHLRSVDDGLVARRRDAPVTPAGAGPFDTSIICVNADLTTQVAASAADVVDQSFRIGMWYWEVEEFPISQHGGFARLDEVWVATDFVQQAVQRHSPVPVRTLTPPLPQRGPDPTLTRADLGWPDSPVFLFAFDFLSTAERKNPWGLVEAFTRAFGPQDGPVLVLKSINADQRPADAERLRLQVAAHPHVILDERYVDAAERDAMMALADCYVSLHRSEGLGLTMAEAMAWGKPVVATGYSGNLDFMTPENSFLVPWTPVAIGPDAAPYPAGAMWADPDLDAAARLLRLVVDDPDLAAARGRRAAADIATIHSPSAAGQRMAQRLSDLSAQRRARSRVTLRARAERLARAALGAARR